MMPDRSQLIHEAKVEGNIPSDPSKKETPKKEEKKSNKKETIKKVLDLLSFGYRFVRSVFVALAYWGCIVGAVYSVFTAAFTAGIFYVLSLFFLKKVLKEILEEDQLWLKLKGLI
jgi:hypothetical protein